MLAFLTIFGECGRSRRRSSTRRHVESNDSNAQKMDAMIQKGLSMLGHNTYTQDYRREQVFSEPGFSDCSAFCWKMYERYFGIYVGSWTGEQITKGTMVVKGTGGPVTSAQMAQLVRGDLLFYGVNKVSHVEMYIGNGQQLGHGSGMGPKLVQTLQFGGPGGGFNHARRYVDIGGGSSGFNVKGVCYCTADALRIRSGPWGTIIGMVYKNQQMEYDGTSSGEWIHIRCNGVIGYVHQNYVRY